MALHGNLWIHRKPELFKAAVDKHNSKYLNISFLPEMIQKDNGKKIIKNIS